MKPTLKALGLSLLTVGVTAPCYHTVILTMRLRTARNPSLRASMRKNRHIPCVNEHTGQPGLLLLLGGSEEP